MQQSCIYFKNFGEPESENKTKNSIQAFVTVNIERKVYAHLIRSIFNWWCIQLM